MPGGGPDVSRRVSGPVEQCQYGDACRPCPRRHCRRHHRSGRWRSTGLMPGSCTRPIRDTPGRDLYELRHIGHIVPSVELR